MATFLQQLANGLFLGSIYALLALGYTMVYGVLRLINFAHGDVYMLGAYAGFGAAAWLGLPDESVFSLIAALILAMVGCAIAGMIIERFAYRPLRHGSRLALLIVAIGVSLLLENGGQVVFGSEPRFFPQLIAAHRHTILGVVVNDQQLVILAVSIVLVIALELFVQRTRTGKAMRAVSYNIDAAKLMGIDTDRVILITFTIGSVLAAAAGCLIGLDKPKLDPLMGVMTGLKAFVAAVLGGIGNLTGAVLGGALIGIAETLIVWAAPSLSSFREAVVFLILIVILIFRPQGLLGSIEGDKA